MSQTGDAFYRVAVVLEDLDLKRITEDLLKITQFPPCLANITLKQRRQNNKTREIYYESSGQVPAQHDVSFGYAANPNLPAGPDFTAAVGSRLEGFPLWVNPPL